MWFWKKKNNKSYYRYSINEKIAYYRNMYNNGTSVEKKRAVKNLTRLKAYKKSNKLFGKVFIVKDKEFNPYASDVKSRRVVLVGVDKDKAKVISVRKNKRYILLSKFDNDRYLDSDNIHALSFNNLYEKRQFSRTNNDYLTKKEKKELLRKIKK